MQIRIETPSLPEPTQQHEALAASVTAISTPLTPDLDNPGRLNHWRSLVEQRVKFALRRLEKDIREARVRVRDINGHKGGIDKECQVTLQTDGRGTIVVVSRARGSLDAVNAALHRATHALLKNWQRKRRADRRSRPQTGQALPAGT